MKFLAELASESENEGALDIIRVQSLTLVGSAFGPLIYDMKKEIGYEKLLALVKSVSENSKKNPGLDEKLVSFKFFFYLQYLFELNSIESFFLY